MKKLAIVVLAAVFAMALAGCGGSAGSSSASSAASEASSAASSSDSAASSEASVGMANPWHEAATAEEAGKGAGLATGFNVSDDLRIGELVWREVTYSYMQGVAQADFDGGAVAFTVRKGEGVSGQEFTGDYNDYEFTWTWDVDGVEVTCSGHEEGIANLAEWSLDSASYAAYCQGLGGDNYGLDEAGLKTVLAGVK